MAAKEAAEAEKKLAAVSAKGMSETPEEEVVAGPVDDSLAAAEVDDNAPTLVEERLESVDRVG